jgi:hypothetical protein
MRAGSLSRPTSKHLCHLLIAELNKCSLCYRPLDLRPARVSPCSTFVLTPASPLPHRRPDAVGQSCIQSTAPRQDRIWPAPPLIPPRLAPHASRCRRTINLAASRPVISLPRGRAGERHPLLTRIWRRCYAGPRTEWTSRLGAPPHRRTHQRNSVTNQGAQYSPPSRSGSERRRRGAGGGGRRTHATA